MAAEAPPDLALSGLEVVSVKTRKSAKVAADDDAVGLADLGPLGAALEVALAGRHLTLIRGSESLRALLARRIAQVLTPPLSPADCGVILLGNVAQLEKSAVLEFIEAHEDCRVQLIVVMAEIPPDWLWKRVEIVVDAHELDMVSDCAQLGDSANVTRHRLESTHERQRARWPNAKDRHWENARLSRMLVVGTPSRRPLSWMEPEEPKLLESWGLEPDERARILRVARTIADLDERSETRERIPATALEQARQLCGVDVDELRDWFGTETQRSVESLLRQCAAAQESGVFGVGESVIYSDHGEPRQATVLEVVWFSPGRLRGYWVEVEGMGPNPVRLNAFAFEVSAPEIPDN